MSIRHQKARKAIILLIVLGMLSLFSVLVVSYVVFSANMRDSSFAQEDRRRNELSPKLAAELALTALISGTDDANSVAFGNSFLEDLYGTDGYVMRVGHDRDGSGGMPNPLFSRGMLLRPLGANGRPQSTLFKLPTSFASWHADGPSPLPGTLTANPPADVRQLDDVFAGRELTFEEGPLAGHTFRIVRYFGTNNDNGSTEETFLSGSVVIDLSELPSEEIVIDGRTERLYEVAAENTSTGAFVWPPTPGIPSNPPPLAQSNGNRFLYDPGPDGRAGNRNVDDDGDGQVDEYDELGFPQSDDFGYRIVINGAKFNGRGSNPSGLTGVMRAGDSSTNALPARAMPDVSADIEISLNPKLMGRTAGGGDGVGTFRFPEQDEQWDAPDMENIWLGYQPSDHRAWHQLLAGRVYTGVNSVELNRALGQHIIPSFHRPAVINYLMNAPIYLPSEYQLLTNTDPNDDPAIRTFFDIDPSNPQTGDVERLAIIMTRLRRATLRPLNFEHFFVNLYLSDLNGDGTPYEGNPRFTGSNPTPILNEIISVNENSIRNSAVDFNILYDKIERLAVWLVNGPWDVDNDGDGLPDSIWTDFNLPLVQAPNGQWLKPMVAALIEATDNRINANYHGNYGQLLNLRVRKRNLLSYTSDSDFFEVMESMSNHTVGGGLGPAEVDFSHLFDERRPGGFPVFGTQLGRELPWGSLNTTTLQPTQPVTLFNFLNLRYANLMNVRYGGPVHTHFPSQYPNNRDIRFPGNSSAASNATELANTDLLSRIPFPSRSTNVHNPASVMGRPLDMFGLMQPGKDPAGNAQFTPPPGATEVINQPYEFGANEVRGDDAPFTPAEYVDFVGTGRMQGRLTQLLKDEADRNPALRRLIATESRSFDVPELVDSDGVIINIAHFMASQNSIANPRVKQQSLDRMMAVEFRKGAKLNLNRPLGNGADDSANNLYDEPRETGTRLSFTTTGAPPTPVADPNTPNNRRAAERAFPQIATQFPNQATVNANYTPITLPSNDFDGFDLDANGVIETGTDHDGDGIPEKIADGNELLARHLYCLMFSLIADPSATEFVQNFPYPPNFTADPDVRNRYVARRIAQWAVNAVDYRDADARCTRLRYDPNPFDATGNAMTDGFGLQAAAQNVVWGMERPEIEITETLAIHDKRLKRNLETEVDPATGRSPAPDNQELDDEDPDPTDAFLADQDMDQFRIPQATAIIELRALASPVATSPPGQPSLPRELYRNNGLDLGLMVGAGALQSPVWRIAVGEPTNGMMEKSTRWVFDADRVARDLVAGQNRSEELSYLNDPGNSVADWTDATAVNTAVDDWAQAVQHSADVRNSFDPAAPGAYVTIGDDDFDPTNDATSRYQIQLERFVWFASVQPDATMNVINDPRSGMRRDNVYFHKGVVRDPPNGIRPINNAGADPELINPVLTPGQYAIVAPRIQTFLGQTTNSRRSNRFEFDPVDQRLEIVDYAGLSTAFRFNYFGHNDANPQTPFYEDPDQRDVKSILPIIVESLYPNETGTGDPKNWTDYRSTTDDNREVDMGFNISAPLPNANYYEPPTDYIRDVPGGGGGPPIPPIPPRPPNAPPLPPLGPPINLAYSYKDGYRNYDNGGGGPAARNFHPDTPLDHIAGTPLEDNGWNAVGTHQEVRTVFLQRLADPTIPWNAIDNPYITVDFSPIDLTTINGEENVAYLIDRDQDGAVNEPVDNVSPYDPGTGEFTPRLRFDSRRKIPDVRLDRVASQLLPNVVNPAVAGDFDRVPIAIRSPLSATFSVLRNAGSPPGPNAHWPYEIGSMWNNGSLVGGAAAINTEFQNGLTFDAQGARFRQTIGFVNREYGQPARVDSNNPSNTPRTQSGFWDLGAPYECMLNLPTWMNREFQSPYDLISVPATSRTSLLNEFSPGTILQDMGQREVMSRFNHLLGFEAGFARAQAGDESDLVHPLRQKANANQVSGNRAALEQIFDFVDIGPVAFDQSRWFEPNQVNAIGEQQINASGSTLVTQTRDRMFNRSVETLQPPFNYISRQRTPGRVNISATPDYIRRGSRNRTSQGFLDLNERPDALNDVSVHDDATVYNNRIKNSPVVNTTTGNADFTEYHPLTMNSSLVAGGSVYRSLAWGISNYYELNDSSQNGPISDAQYMGQQHVIGERNYYEASVDSRFGRDFKAYMESRRGYANSRRQNSGWLLNPELDFRYPTRFAGMFAPAQSARIASVQRFMRRENNDGNGVLRRSHDMGIWRPHPDFDERLMGAAARNAFNMPTDTSYSLKVEEEPVVPFKTSPPSNPTTVLPAISNNANPAASYAYTPRSEVDDLRMPLANKALFQRSEAELSGSFRFLSRDGAIFYRNLKHDANHRFADVARMANMTTHHSNVFSVQMTIGYFVVDPATGAVGEEYVNDTGNTERSRSMYIVDRSIPVGFVRGRPLNSHNTVIYSSEDE